MSLTLKGQRSYFQQGTGPLFHLPQLCQTLSFEACSHTPRLVTLKELLSCVYFPAPTFACLIFARKFPQIHLPYCS